MTSRTFAVMTTAAFLAAVLITVPAAPSVPEEKYPFFPSLLNSKTGKPVPTSDYEEPEKCRGCHKDIFSQWNGSMHSNAFVDPVFVAMWKLGEKETKGAVRTLCAGCHTPIGTVAGEVAFNTTQDAFQVSKVAARGVSCDFCHTVSESTWKDTPTGQPQNASLILDPGETKRGPYKDSDSPGHDTAFSELHTSAEFCGSCHHVFHPVTNFPIERTYDEWRQSVYARAGIVCQDCHMMPVEKAVEAARTLQKPKNPGKASPMGPDRDNVFTHEFVGANFTVPMLLKSETHARIAEARLKSAAEITLHLPQAAVPGELARFEVEVANVAAGHNLPTSLTEVREMWLDVTVTDEKGQVLLRSGAVDAKGHLDEKAAIFNAIAVDKDGKVTHKPWEISHFRRFRVIPPKGSDIAPYVFLVPEKAKKGNLTVQAVLRYRSCPQEVANELLGEGAPLLPIVDMASISGPLPVGKP